MTDTAEYWWDVKGYNKKSSRVFNHIKGYDCGHFHVHETSKLLEVDCYACLRHIENTAELKQSKQAKEEYRFRFGKCSCGSPMQIKKNRNTNQEFLGCSNYPKCKNTRNL
jgi:ssDNA-binding Zn-finger/Zn-ribbon topoisomerase 1